MEIVHPSEDVLCGLQPGGRRGEPPIATSGRELGHIPELLERDSCLVQTFRYEERARDLES